MNHVLPILALTLLSACQTLGLSYSSDKAATAPPAAPSVVSAPSAPHRANVAVADGWASATPKGAKVAAGFFTARNAGNADDRLIAASSPRAGHVDFHEMSMKGMTMKMRPLKDVDVPAGGSIEFKQGGMHLMFTDIKGAFVEGDTIPVKLTFEKVGDVDVSLTVHASQPSTH